MSKRKFYKTIIQLEVLSEYPIEDKTLGDINYEIDEGDCSGLYTTLVQDEICDGKEMAELLIKQGSEPEFFMLDENGNDLNEEG